MSLNVRAWLEAEGFGQFADLFESRQIDGDALPLLTEAHLTELGIAMGPRIKLLAAIARLGAHGAGVQEDASAERRRLTVMFVDLVGSTALSTRLDPEELRDLIRRYQRAIAVEADRYEAHVAQYLGDGAMLYFGYPKAHEDDAERAVRAALAIVRVVSAQRSPAGDPLAVRIGIATGLVVVGDLLGSTGERAVVGETPNVAARLQSLAGPGDILVSAQTRTLAGNVFEWRDLGAQQMKGLAAPIPVHAALAERAVETRFDGRQGLRLSALVGRESELETLVRCWKRAAQGEGQFVVLTGEAGIGKSRLLRALSAEIAADRHVRITNQCSPYHTDTPLHPMIQHIARAAEIGPAQSPAEQLDHLDILLKGAHGSEVALTAALLGIDGSERYGKLDFTPERQRAQTFEALLNHLLRVSERAPVLWVLEDIHWIDPTSLELMRLCIDRIAAARVLAVVTARPELVPDFAPSPHLTRLVLGRLGREHVAAMIEQVTRGKTLPDSVMTEIAAKTDGVPLFVEELTKTVLETGELLETTSAFVLEGAPRGISVPASLHDSMMARLDRHGALKDLAQAAACIGREFSRDLLAKICDVPAQALREGLDRLAEAQLVFCLRAPLETHYVFKHALLRDAAYESLLKSKRQAIHARIVDALENVPESPPEILAQHALESGLVEKAIDYWQRAGTMAIARPAYREAISHLNHALRVAEGLGNERKWQERRLQLLLLLGQATIPLLGYSHSETLAVFLRAQELSAALGDTRHRFSISYAMWVTRYVRGEHAQALAVAQDMHRRAQEENRDSHKLTALRALGIEQMITGELLDAHATFEEAQKLAHILQAQSSEHRIAVAQRFGADPDIATQFHIALTLWAIGHVDRACALVAQAVAAARAMGHVHTLGHALTHGAIFAAVMRDAAQTRQLSDETIAFADAHDMDLWRGYGAIINAYALILSGEPAQAIGIMERGFRHLERTQTGTMVRAYRAVHAYALATQGRFADAAREALLAEREFSSGLERYHWCEAFRWLGDYRALLPDARPLEVEQAYEQALALARAQHALSLELGAATSLARLWADRGERVRAFNLLAPLHGALTEGLGTPGPRAAAELLASLRAGDAAAPELSIDVARIGP